MWAAGKGMKLDENWYVSIIRKVDELNLQNQRLISIAQQMMKTSFLTISPNQTPPIITKIQEDMRASFNALIEGVREYFIVIDDKLKQIGIIIEGKLLQERPPERNENVHLGMLVKRIEHLEENLKKTSQKQSKLINIIEEMAQKDSFEESILNRSKDRIQQSIEASNQHESSFRIFSAKQPMHDPYPRPYSIIDTQHSQPKFRKPKSPSNLCMMQQKESIRCIPLPKRSLKGRQFQVQCGSKMHRMSYMMKVLKN